MPWLVDVRHGLSHRCPVLVIGRVFTVVTPHGVNLFLVRATLANVSARHTSVFFLVFLSFRPYPVGIDVADACFYCELACKEKHTAAASKTKSWSERKGFYGFFEGFQLVEFLVLANR